MWRKPHFWWLWGLLLVAFSLIVVPFTFIDGESTAPGWKIQIDSEDTGTLRTILINLGTTLLMAAVLLYLEPKIRSEVTKVAKQSFDDAATEITTSMKSEIRQDFEGMEQKFEKKFASLNEELEARLQERLNVKTEKIAAFGSDPTYDKTREAIEAAVESNSLHNSEILVQATGVPGELVLGMNLNPGFYGRYSDRPDHIPLSDYRLNLAGRKEGSTTYVSVEWKPDESYAEAMAKLFIELEKGKIWGTGNVPDLDAVHQRLVDGLEVAVKAPSNMEGSVHFEGSLIEVFGTNPVWYLTDSGIECPDESFRIDRQKFNEGPPTYPSPAPNVGDKPAWADEQVWEYAIRRGEDQFSSFPF